MGPVELSRSGGSPVRRSGSGRRGPRRRGSRPGCRGGGACRPHGGGARALRRPVRRPAGAGAPPLRLTRDRGGDRRGRGLGGNGGAWGGRRLTTGLVKLGGLAFAGFL